MTTTIPPHMRAWQDDPETPDAGPEPGDVVDETQCDACGIWTDAWEAHVTRSGNVVCPTCWRNGVETQP